MLATQAVAVLQAAQLALLKVGAEQQQYIDFKSWLMYFTSRLCDCAFQT